MLIFSRRFLPLFSCQFFSAFNDNFLKTSLVFLILFGATDGPLGADHAGERDLHRAVSSSCRRSAASWPTGTTRRGSRNG